MKVCSKCKTEKLLSEYAKSKTERFGVRSKCKSCVTLYNIAYNKSKNPDRPQKQISGLSKKEYDRLWNKTHRDKRNSYHANRRSLQKSGTFAGYKKEIEQFYWLARDLKAITGEVYHVDHIVPLKGKNVCGLHVPWNLQVIPADINLSKNNYFGFTKEEI